MKKAKQKKKKRYYETTQYLLNEKGEVYGHIMFSTFTRGQFTQLKDAIADAAGRPGVVIMRHIEQGTYWPKIAWLNAAGKWSRKFPLTRVKE